MIRFVYIGDQIYDGEKQFCFFDTVIDRFVSIGGEHVFDNRQDAYDRMRANKWPEETIARFIGLIPDRIKAPIFTFKRKPRP